MAEKVPYQPFSTRQMSGAPGEQLSEHASPNAFGAGVAEAAKELGDKGSEILEKRQERVNKLYANDASTSGMASAGKIWDEYGRLEGKAAHEAWPKYQQRFIDNYHSAIEAAPNDQAKELLSNSMKFITDRYLGYGEAHAAKEYDRWDKKSHSDRAAQLGNQAALARDHNDELMHGFVDAGAKQLADYYGPRGYGADEIKAEQEKYRGGVYKDIIESKANSGDVRGAKELFEQIQKDPQRTIDHGSIRTIEGFLKPKVEAIEAQNIADKHLGRVTGATAASPEGRHWTDKFSALESGQKDPIKGVSNISADTHGSHSYGNFGLNSLPGNSAWKFQEEYGERFGLTAPPGSAAFDAQWRMAAHNDAKGLRAAELSWHIKHVEAPAIGILQKGGAPESLTRDPRVQQYMADRYVQHGGLHAQRAVDVAKQANGDPDAFIRMLSEEDRLNVQRDFPSFLAGMKTPQAREQAIRGLQNRVDNRDQISRTATPAEMGGGAPAAPAAQGTPAPFAPHTQGELDLAGNRPTPLAREALNSRQAIQAQRDREAQNVGATYERNARQTYANLPDKGEVMARAAEEARQKYPDNPNMQNLVLNRVREAYSIKQADAADEAHQEKKHKDLLHTQMLTAEDEYIRDALGGSPKKSAKDIINDPRLAVDPQKREHLIKLYAGDGDGVDKDTSAKNTRNLSKRITDEKDPHHVVDMGAINSAYYNGEITRSDWDKLSKEFKEFRTEDGNSFLKAKNKFYEAVKPEIIKAIPGVPYPPSNLQYYEYTRAMDAKIESMRKAGKSPDEIEKLFTAAPGGFGSPDFLAPYQAGIKEAIDYQSTAIRRNNAPKLSPEKLKEMNGVLHGGK